MLGSPSTFPSLSQALIDRRDRGRARLATTVTLTAAGRLVDAMAIDVSPSGMRLVAQGSLAEGLPVSLVFFVRGEMISAEALVRRCERGSRGGYFVYGVAFLRLEDDGAAVVDRYCRSCVS